MAPLEEIDSLPREVHWFGGNVVARVELFSGDELLADLSGPIDNSGSFALNTLDSYRSVDNQNCRIKVTDDLDNFGWSDGFDLGLSILSGPLPGMDFVSIPAGSFEMGSPSSENNRDSNESLHSVRVGSFEIMTTEVTQGMWEEVMGSNPSHDYGEGSNYPVYYVSWEDCQEFIAKLNDLDRGHTYRLPTEAEWEYACRAGTSSAYYWGSSSSESVMKQNCWYEKNADDGYWSTPHASHEGTQPVGMKSPNAWGLYDMSGNVYEWCQDVYTSDYSSCPTDGSAYRGQGSYRVLRGGGWSSRARLCRSANRGGLSPGGRDLNLGFRLARS